MRNRGTAAVPRSTARRTVQGLALLVAATCGLAACTADAAEPRPAASSTAPTPTPTPVPTVATVTGVPAEVGSIVNALYAGPGQVAASPTAAALLQARRPTPQPVQATGTVGNARGAQVAVVTAGNDVTLAVADPAVAGGVWRVVGGWWPSLGAPGPAVGPLPRLVAVVGSDARPGEDVGTSRADSLHIVGLDGTGGGGVVGIPRDSWVPLTTGGTDKINAALARGGPRAMLATLERTSGLDLEGQVITGFAGFVAIVDSLGGVPFFLDRALQDPAADLDLPAGERRLTGTEALAYSRTRRTSNRGDIDRQLNGGLVLLAAGGVVQAAGPGALPGLLQAADPHLVSDLSAEQLLTLAAGVLRLDGARVPNAVLPARIGTAGKSSVVFLEPGTREMFADLADGNLTP
jgi:polyisoprenyl-teichoic acid--peptidoglycan teichoic acid transferase